MKKYILMLLILTISICFVTCSSEPPDVECPNWSAPQPIDSLLLGTWELVEVISPSGGYDSNSIYEIAFYENNYYVQATGRDEVNVSQSEHRGSVSGNTLILPDYCDCGTERFLDYNYSISADSTLLYIESVSYPYVSGANCLDILIVPLFVTEGTFNRIE